MSKRAVKGELNKAGFVVGYRCKGCGARIRGNRAIAHDPGYDECAAKCGADPYTGKKLRRT